MNFSGLKKLMKNKYVLALLLIAVVAVVGVYGRKYLLSEAFGSVEKKIVLFFLPGCSHCEQLQPIWNKVKFDFESNSIIRTVEINGEEEQDEAEKYGVEGFPTIVYMKDDIIQKEYTGDRNYESLRLFFEESIAA